MCIIPASHQVSLPFTSSQLLRNFSGMGNPLPAQIWKQKAFIYVYRAGDLGFDSILCPFCSCLWPALMGRGVWEPMCVCRGRSSALGTLSCMNHILEGFSDSHPPMPIHGCYQPRQGPAGPLSPPALYQQPTCTKQLPAQHHTSLEAHGLSPYWMFFHLPFYGLNCVSPQIHMLKP